MQPQGCTISYPPLETSSQITRRGASPRQTARVELRARNDVADNAQRVTWSEGWRNGADQHQPPRGVPWREILLFRTSNQPGKRLLIAAANRTEEGAGAGRHRFVVQDSRVDLG